MNSSSPAVTMKNPARPEVVPTPRARRKWNLRHARLGWWRRWWWWASFVVAACIACAACGVGEKREGIPAGAQTVVDVLTEDIGEGRADKIYREAADEWRRATTAEQNAAAIERLRARLGRVQSRTAIKRTQQPNAGGALDGHTLELIYQTSFERGAGTENITLVERDGRWLLARYFVSSDLLNP